jgi:hypothetical protein
VWSLTSLSLIRLNGVLLMHTVILPQLLQGCPFLRLTNDCLFRAFSSMLWSCGVHTNGALLHVTPSPYERDWGSSVTKCNTSIHVRPYSHGWSDHSGCRNLQPTNQPTPWSRALLDKLIVTQLVDKFPAMSYPSHPPWLYHPNNIIWWSLTSYVIFSSLLPLPPSQLQQTTHSRAYQLNRTAATK